MELADLIGKTCLIGLTYMTADGDVLKLSQLAGTVTEVDAEEGISVALFENKAQESESESLAYNAAAILDTDETKTKTKTKTKTNKDDAAKTAIFHLPPGLNAWFIAPKGHYKNAEQGIDIENPDYFVTWDIVKKKDDTPEGKHEWWEWHPRTTPPSVG